MYKRTKIYAIGLRNGLAEGTYNCNAMCAPLHTISLGPVRGGENRILDREEEEDDYLDDICAESAD